MKPDGSRGVADFFAQVHALRCMSMAPDKLGFEGQSSATFPTCDGVLRVASAHDVLHVAWGVQFVLTSALCVLVGHLGPLPEYLALASVADEAPAMRALLMLIHHRTMVAWVDSTFAASSRFSSATQQRGRWQQRLWELGDTTCSEDVRVPEAGWRLRAGGKTTAKDLLARFNQILSAYGCEDLPLTFLPLCGGSLRLRTCDRMTLGVSTLAKTTLLGSSMRAAHAASSIVIDVRRSEQWQPLTSTPGLCAALNEALEQLLPMTQACTVFLRLASEILPAMRLAGRSGQGGRLGWNAFVGCQPAGVRLRWLRRRDEQPENTAPGRGLFCPPGWSS